MKPGTSVRSPYVLILPAIALCLIFSIGPTVMLVRDSFRSVDYVAGTDKFVGLANYRSIFTDGVFLRVFGNSVVFMFCSVALSVPLGVAAALFLNRNRFIHNLTQSVIFTPHIVSFIAVAALWMFMMDPGYWVLNYALGLLGLPPLRWLLDSGTSLLSLVIVAVWKSTGFNALIVIAAPKDTGRAVRIGPAGPRDAGRDVFSCNAADDLADLSVPGHDERDIRVRHIRHRQVHDGGRP